MDFDNQVLKVILKKEVNKVQRMINYAPYAVVASDNKKIREFFIDGLKDKVIVMKDYELYYPKRKDVYSNLKKNNILLLDFEQKVQKYREHCKNDFDKSWHATYYALIPYRDLFRQNDMHSIVIVCDNATAYDIMRDANLGSAVFVSFIDRHLERSEILHKHNESVEENKDNLSVN